MTINCINPFKIRGHYNCKRSLRKVQRWMLDVIDSGNILSTSKICSTCRIRILNVKKSEIQLEELEQYRAEQEILEDQEEAPGTEEVIISKLNETLPYIDQTPIKKKKLLQRSYRINKFKKISSSIKKKLFLDPKLEPSAPHKCPESEIIDQLKEKLKSTTNNNDKIHMLTILPKSWTLRKIVEEFNISNFMARRVKLLVEEKGVFSTPEIKPRNIILPDVVNTVKTFFETDEVSRCLPGIKDYISVKENGWKVKKTKRLLLGNLREVYSLFKERHEDVKIGLSKFCQLRPQNVILANASGSHNVCVCTKHQNVKLMLHALKLKKLTENSNGFEMETYKDCFEKMICNTASPMCYLGKCTECPGMDDFKNKLNELLELNSIEEITYKQWIYVDRDKLETLIKPAGIFLDSLCEKLQILLPHSFIAKEQAAFLAEKKTSLKDNEYLVMCDFSENATFVVQDSVQGFHWNNTQATLYPIAIYYNSNGKIEHTNFIIISECLKHNTVAVHLFNKQLITFLSKKFGKTPKKIIYFSDGSAAQYKNKKNFVNLCHHVEDFGCDAEWHFFVTSHGKGPSDGLGGTVKREARRASLQRPLDGQITTPRHLFDWCCANLKNCNFGFLTEHEHNEQADLLKLRFLGLRTIPGTQKMHCFIPQGKKKLKIKHYSADREFLIENIYN